MQRKLYTKVTKQFYICAAFIGELYFSTYFELGIEHKPANWQVIKGKIHNLHLSRGFLNE